MDLRTTVITVILLGAGYTVGSLTTTAALPAGDFAPQADAGASAPAETMVGLSARHVESAPPPDTDIAESLARIERLLAMNPMAAGTPDEKVVERVTEVWRPILLQAIESHETARVRTRLITLFEQRIADAEVGRQREQDAGRPGGVAEYEREIRELRERIGLIRATSTAQELLEALTTNPDAKGGFRRSDAILIVYGDADPR